MGNGPTKSIPSNSQAAFGRVVGFRGFWRLRCQKAGLRLLHELVCLRRHSWPPHLGTQTGFGYALVSLMGKLEDSLYIYSLYIYSLYI